MSIYPFIGLQDIVSQISDLKKGFSQLGFDSYACFSEESPHAANEGDKMLADGWRGNINIRPKILQNLLRLGFKREAELKKAVKKHDVFIFVWQTFRDDSSDLAYLKSLGKKIVVFFMGSEQRWSRAYQQEMKNYGISDYYANFPPEHYHFGKKELEMKIRYLRNVEKYADVIYSLPNQSQLSLKPYHHFYIPVDTGIIKETARQREIPIITHAPTSRGLKGTNVVIEAFERLKNEGVKFEIQLIENMPYFEALEEYTKSDIVIGELHIPSGGKLDREALAAGKVVLSSVHREYIDKLPVDCPIIDINPDNFYEELKKIILDYPRRVELAKQGRPFVEKYHDTKVVCQDILDKLEEVSNGVENYDFYPKFFRQEFKPEDEYQTNLYNYWTNYVSKTEWYKKFVPKGERDGLIF